MWQGSEFKVVSGQGPFIDIQTRCCLCVALCELGVTAGMFREHDETLVGPLTSPHKSSWYRHATPASRRASFTSRHAMPRQATARHATADEL